MSMKNPLTPAGIKQVTFRFVAQHLNHCATAVPLQIKYVIFIMKEPVSYNKFISTIIIIIIIIIIMTFMKVNVDRVAQSV